MNRYKAVAATHFSGDHFTAHSIQFQRRNDIKLVEYESLHKRGRPGIMSYFDMDQKFVVSIVYERLKKGDPLLPKDDLKSVVPRVGIDTVTVESLPFVKDL